MCRYHGGVKGAMTRPPTQRAITSACACYSRVRKYMNSRVKSSSDSGKACPMMTEEPLEQVRKERAKKH